MSRALTKKDIHTHIVWNNETREYEMIDLETGDIVSSHGLQTSIGRYVFNAEIAILICQELRQGRTMSEVGNDPRFPPIEVISHWKRMHPLFEDQIKLARKDRAEGYHDKIVMMADKLQGSAGIVGKDEIAANKVAMDAYKWAAEKGDPEAFGKKQEITHQNTQPQTIVVNTGIVRSKPDVVVTKTIEEQL